MPSEAVRSLINDLHSARGVFKPDWNKRIAAAQRLGELRAAEAVSDLAAVVQENQNADLVRAALQAMGQIGTPEAAAALVAVLGGSTLSSASWPAGCWRPASVRTPRRRAPRPMRWSSWGSRPCLN